MGEKDALDEAATDRRAARVPLPESVARELTMRLDILSSMPASVVAALGQIWRALDALATHTHE
jgi:hypothetical protein